MTEGAARKADPSLTIEFHCHTSKLLATKNEIQQRNLLFKDTIAPAASANWVSAAKTFFVNLASTAGLRRIDVTGSADQIKKLEQHVRSVWARYGQTDPYFSVLTVDKFRAENISSADIDEFYAGGLTDFNSMLECCQRNGVTPNPNGTVLDFGCGLGRIGEHLSRYFAHYVGVDISKPHLDQASARFDAIGRKNGAFRLLPGVLQNPSPSISYFLSSYCSTTPLR